jgi:hypothetical protein
MRLSLFFHFRVLFKNVHEVYTNGQIFQKSQNDFPKLGNGMFQTLKLRDSFILGFLLNIQSHQLVVFNKIFQMLCCTLQLEIILLLFLGFQWPIVKLPLWFSIIFLAITFSSQLQMEKCHNFKIKITIKCKVQRLMKSRECVWVWNTLSQMGENVKHKTWWFSNALPFWKLQLCRCLKLSKPWLKRKKIPKLGP